MTNIPPHRIAPSQPDHTGRNRLITYDYDRPTAGPDPDQNFCLCPWADMDDATRQVRLCIDHALAHPELQFSTDRELLRRRELMPLFAMARHADNIALPESWWMKWEEQQIEAHGEVLTFGGVAKRPVTVKYHLLSNNIRYGVAEGQGAGQRRCFAFYGTPQRNDDYFEIAPITEAEHRQCQQDFGGIDSYLTLDAMAPTFRARYVEDRPLAFEGWDLPDVLWVEGGE